MTRSKPVYAPQSLFDLNDELRKKRESVGKAVDELKGTKSLTDAERKRVLDFRDKLQMVRWSRREDELAAQAPLPMAKIALGPWP
jgi:hypothetical protein